MSIQEICEKYNIVNYTINDDGSVDVDGHVFLDNHKLTELPLTFNHVLGSFYCYDNNLTSLKGCPENVGGYFDCSNNQLTNLEHCPKHISGGFMCIENRLTTLEYSPKYVGYDFSCVFNSKLKDNYCETEIVGDFYSSTEQDGLIFKGYIVDNYKEWRTLRKRKLILDKLNNGIRRNKY